MSAVIQELFGGVPGKQMRFLKHIMMLIFYLRTCTLQMQQRVMIGFEDILRMN